MGKAKEKIKQSLAEIYQGFVDKFIKNAQESNSIPGYYTYRYKNHLWLLQRPRSVMEQKRVINLMRKHMAEEFNFDVEMEFLRAVCQNTQKDKVEVQLESLELDEVELLKKNYIDWILLPLFLTGTRAIENYMEEKLKQTGLLNK